MGTSTLNLWKQLLLSSIQANSHLKHHSYFQLATVSSSNRPSNHTVVFRGFQDDGDTDKILINTDTRSKKVDYVNLKSNERVIFTSGSIVDEQKLWTSERVNA